MHRPDYKKWVKENQPDFKGYSGDDNPPLKTREYIIRRDGNKCYICGKLRDWDKKKNYTPKHQAINTPEAVLVVVSHHKVTERMADGMQLHHIFPRKEGGADHPKNIITLCVACHRKIHNGEVELTEKTEQKQVKLSIK